MSLLKNFLVNLKGYKFCVFVVLFWIIIGIILVIFVSFIGNGF